MTTELQTTLTITIPGKPQPAGSKRAVPSRNGKFASVIDANPKAADWKRLVRLAAFQQLPAGWVLLTYALQVDVTFFVQRPAAHYKTGKNAGKLRGMAPAFPAKKPDATKLMRGTEDALTGVVWADDAQIVTQTVKKRYATENKAPCTVIEIAAAEPLVSIGAEMELRGVEYGAPPQTPISGSAAISTRRNHE